MRHETEEAPSAEMGRRYEEWARRSLERWLPRDAPEHAATLAWVQSRYREGQALAALLRERLPQARLRVLDLGAGNGGVSLGLHADPGYEVIAADCYLNGEVPDLLRETKASFGYVVARGESLPFPDGFFDAVLLLDVIEHVRRPRSLCLEASRVLRAGGIIVITTPPRARFLFKGDPHLGIPGLALLPAFGQRIVAERLLRRTRRYDVSHLYLTARGVARALPSGFTVSTLGGQGKLGRLGLDWEKLLACKVP